MAKQRLLLGTCGFAIVFFIILAVAGVVWRDFARQSANAEWLDKQGLRSNATISFVEIKGVENSVSCKDPASLDCLTRLIRRGRATRLPPEAANMMGVHADLTLVLADGSRIQCESLVRPDALTLIVYEGKTWSSTFLDLPLPEDTPDKLKEMFQFISDRSSRGMQQF